MKSALNIILKKCMGLRPDETCLVMTDNTEDRREIAEMLFDLASLITPNTELLVIPEIKVNGQEPSIEVAKEMREFDVILILTRRSLTHTMARKNACASGSRVASMPGITKDIIFRAIDVDYDEMIKRTNLLADELDKAEMVRVTTEIGTDISFSIKDRHGRGRKAGVINNPGDYGNLPEAEAFLAPVEGTANGVYIVDSSQGGIGKLATPIKVTVKDGFAVEISGGAEASKLRQTLESIKDKNAFNIAEFGIGTNDKAQITGIILEDEKVLGTCHIALGNNSGFGGNVNVPVHVDGVMLKPTIYLDDKMIMDNGNLIISKTFK